MGKQTNTYLNDLDLKHCIYKDEILSQLVKHMTRKDAKKTLYAFDNAIKSKNMQRIYSLKNSSLTTSLVLSSAHEYNIYNQIGDWIEKNTHIFKGNILDVGCDGGIMTCLMATLLPEHKITAIDINPISIKCAQELAQKLNLDNVNFICCSLNDVKETFDTVFEMRILHENIDVSTAKTFFLDYESKITHFKNECNNVVESTSRIINSNGAFISIIRSSVNELFTAYLLKQSEYGFAIDFKNLKQLEIQEVTSKNDFQVIVSHKKNSPVSQEEDVLGFLLNVFKRIWDTPKTEGFQGDLKFFLRHEKLLRGILVYEKDKLVMKYALYSTDDPTTLYLLCKSYLHSEDCVFAYDISDRQDCLSEIDRVANDYRLQKKIVIYMEN